MDLFLKWGLDRNCTDADVRRVYRMRVQQSHPDRIGQTSKAQADFCVLQEEYLTLKTLESRQKYLRTLEDIEPPSPSPETFIIGRGFVPPSSLHVEVYVPLDKIVTGGVVLMKTPYSYPCLCQRMSSCSLCQGTGQRWALRQINVTFPACIPDGSEMCIDSAGHQGTMENGSLFITIRWKNTHGWRSAGLYFEKSIHLPLFMLRRGKVWIRSPNGRIGFVLFDFTRVLTGQALIVPLFEGKSARIWITKRPWAIKSVLGQFLLAFSAKWQRKLS